MLAGALASFRICTNKRFGWVAQIPVDSHKSLEGALFLAPVVILGEVSHHLSNCGHGGGRSFL